MTTTYVPASSAQISYLKDLLDTRKVGDAYKESIRQSIEAHVLSKTAASTAITYLIDAPRYQLADKPAASASPLQKALASVHKSFYAVPTEEIDLGIVDANTNQSLFFVEVKEYMGTLYMRRLHGAPGGFSRSKLSTNDQLTILKVIETDQVKYAKLFGEHHGVCGKCGAELTDDESRRLQFGPVCRKTMKI